MIVKNNVDLSKYTTFKMCGTAKKMYIPESEDELVDLINTLHPEYFLGGGSNLLINERLFECVVNLRKFSDEIKNLGNGRFIVGASVRLQKLIKSVNELGYGGIEYLYSVPGLVGGAITMNAGRGAAYKKSIADYILSVKVYHEGKILWINKQDCGFGYRHSIFLNSNYIILSAEFCFEKIDSDEAKKLCVERINLCKKMQDNSLPNFGTVFCVSDPRIMKLMMTFLFRKQGHVRFSKKTPNWILNDSGRFQDAIRLLRRVQNIHKILKKECRTEVVIWK